jgi:hypothetical protein
MDPSGKILLKAPADQFMTYAGFSYSADGSRLVVLSRRLTGADVYDTSDWKLSRHFELSNISDVAISPDGRFLAGINQLDKAAVVWDVGSGERLAKLDTGLQPDWVQFNPAGDLLIVTGTANLDHPDGFSTIGTLFETQTWSRLDNLYTFSYGDGKMEFSRDGRRMAVLGNTPTIWEVPDAPLLEGLNVVKQFQAALHGGDYAGAASLFGVDEREVKDLATLGVDRNDLAGSFKRLCDSQAILCQPVKDLVLMGYDGDTMVYMVHLSGADGGTFTSPKGAQIIYIFLKRGTDGKVRIIYPGVDL